ncbi:hypothetical protein G6011_06714 [Alternaria panax]|uniref:Uncharacterized protein n=1 Tax=Alternaria panax TaxID=48097 RepID=A0AAD4FHS0_9PLEO|nr:hypothetical protein G6011_06714 [Alternaria panax]
MGPVKYVWYIHNTTPTHPTIMANSAANSWGRRFFRFQISPSNTPFRKMYSSCTVIVIQRIVQYPIKLTQLMKISKSESRPAIAMTVNTMQENVLQIGLGIFANGADTIFIKGLLPRSVLQQPGAQTNA